jgi:hypothetical protein
MDRIAGKRAVAVAVLEVVDSHAAPEASAEPSRTAPAGTEADKIRRQQHVRRKVQLARRALAAHRR